MAGMRPLSAAAAGFLVLLLVAGCGGSGQSPTTSSLDVPSLEVPSLGPPQASGPSSAAPPSVQPSPAASLGEPAVARIATGVTTAVDGVLGRWRVDDQVNEQDWIDLALLERTDLPSDELVFAGWADGTPIAAWSLRVAPVSDATGERAVHAGSGAGNGADFVTIGRVDAGTWILELTLTRADGRGEATYYWELLAE